MKLKQKDLVLLPYPYSDLKRKKVRPVLVLSNDKINKKSEDIIVAPLTGVSRNFPFSVEISQNDLRNGWLIKRSRVKVNKIFSVEKNLAIMNIGSLKDKTFRKIRKEFFNLI